MGPGCTYYLDGETLTYEQMRARLASDKSLFEKYVGESARKTPEMPFQKDWPLALFKRALRDAVASGKEWIGWTSGTTQGERYDLSKQVKEISANPTETGYTIGADGNTIATNVPQEKLADYVGKDIAKKIIAGEGEPLKDGNRHWREATKPQSISELGANVFGGKMASLMSLDVVDGGMLAASNHDQIRKLIISLLPVDVMNDLRAAKLSPDDLFSNENMVAEKLPVDSRESVASGIVSAVRSAATTIRAKLESLRTAGGDGFLLPTLKASDLNAREIAGLLLPQTVFHHGPDSGEQSTTTARLGAESAGRPSRDKLTPTELAEFLNFHASIAPRNEGIVKQFVAPSGVRLTGDNLKVESAGMKGFYDVILPKDIGKYVKQWGASVSTAKMDAAGKPLSDGIKIQKDASFLSDPMNRAMGAASENGEITKAIVQNIPVKVMNLLAAQGIDAKAFLSDPKMFSNRLSADAFHSITLGIESALRKVGTDLRTRLDSAYQAGLDAELLPALRASDLDTDIATRILFPESSKIGSSASDSDSGIALSKTGLGTKASGWTSGDKLASADLAEFGKWHAELKRHSKGEVKYFKVNITPEMRESVAKGQPQFMPTPDINYRDKNGELIDYKARQAEQKRIITALRNTPDDRRKTEAFSIVAGLEEGMKNRLKQWYGLLYEGDADLALRLLDASHGYSGQKAMGPSEAARSVMGGMGPLAFMPSNLKEDMTSQASWMEQQAKERGFASATEMVLQDPASFTKLAAQWRMENRRENPDGTLRYMPSNEAKRKIAEMKAGTVDDLLKKIPNLPPSRENNRMDEPYRGEWTPGALYKDGYGENQYIYEARDIDPKMFGELLKLEGMEYKDVVNMPTTQRYIEWYQQGEVPPPITAIKRSEGVTNAGRYVNSDRRRVVAAIEAGVKTIPAFVEIGRANELFQEHGQPQFMPSKETAWSKAGEGEEYPIAPSISGKIKELGFDGWHALRDEWKARFDTWVKNQPDVAAFIHEPTERDGETYERAHVVSKDPTTKGWRVTSFHKKTGKDVNPEHWNANDWNAWGHTDEKSKEDAFHEAATAAGKNAKYSTQPLFMPSDHQKHAEAAGSVFQGEANGLLAFKELSTGGNFSLAPGDATPERIAAEAEKVRQSFAGKPEVTEANLDEFLRSQGIELPPTTQMKNGSVTKGPT